MYGADSAVVATTASDGAVAAVMGVMAGLWLLILVFAVLMIVVLWKVFVKAGKPGWAAIIPIYNIIVLLEIAERPIWWILLMFVPIANIVVEIIVILDVAKKFGKSVVFAIFGLILFPYVGWTMLAFGKSVYQGAAAAPVAPTVPTETPVA